MLDFLKDLYLQASGLDMELIEKERREKIEIEKSKTILIKPKSKKYLVMAGIIFIIIHVFSIIIAEVFHDVTSVIKSSVMIGLAVLILLCSFIKKKSAEILCIVLCDVVILLSVIIPIF